MKSQSAIDDLVSISAFAGERFDLVQAGGGNTSVKINDQMLIKASGYLLSEVTSSKGISTVETLGVLNLMKDDTILEERDKRRRDRLASEGLQRCILQGTDRPSIETYLHALLDRYVLHVHSIAVNYCTSHREWRELCVSLDQDGLLVPYDTPGIELAILLRDSLKEYRAKKGTNPKIIFLQNHGLIVSTNDLSEIRPLTERIVLRAESISGMDLSRYRLTSDISRHYRSVFTELKMAYLSEDEVVQKLIEIPQARNTRPFSPDGFVFCGYRILQLTSLSDNTTLRDYAKKYMEPPKVLLFEGRVFIIAPDLKKAKMMEDVLKNNLMLAAQLGDDIAFLEEAEIHYLGNWEAEKYRQNLS